MIPSVVTLLGFLLVVVGTLAARAGLSLTLLFSGVEHQLQQRFDLHFERGWLPAFLVVFLGGICVLCGRRMPPPSQQLQAEALQFHKVSWFHLVILAAALLSAVWVNHSWKFDSNWILVPMLLLAGYALSILPRGGNHAVQWGRGEVAFLVTAMIAAPCMWLFDWSSWKYSLIGDEVAFFTSAVDLQKKGMVNRYVLEASGVFDDHPVMVTVLQTLSMKLMGFDGFGWKFAGALCGVCCLPALYAYGRRIQRPLVGGGMVVLFVFSMQVMVWAKIGKPHLFLLLPLVWTLLHASRLGERGLRGAFVAGLAAGSGFYFLVLGALASGCCLALGLVGEVVRRRSVVKVLPLVAAATLGWLMVASPILVQEDYFAHLAKKNLASHSMPLEHILKNTFYGLTSHVYYHGSDHFIFGNLLDSCTSVLVTFGIFVSIGRGNLLLLGTWISSVFLSASLAYYSYPPTTRLVLLSVPWICFAGESLLLLCSFYKARWPQVFLVAAAALGSAVLSLWALRDTDARFIRSHQMIVRMAQQMPSAKILVIVPMTWNDQVDQIAFDYLGVSAVVLKDCGQELAQKLEVIASQPSDLEIAILEKSKVSVAVREIIVAGRIPIRYFPLQGFAPSIPVVPPPLSTHDIAGFKILGCEEGDSPER